MTAAHVENFLSAWAEHLNGLERDYQILLVDDGSADDTTQRADGLREKFPRLELLRMKRGRRRRRVANRVGIRKTSAVLLHLVRSALSPGRFAAAVQRHRPSTLRQRVSRRTTRAAVVRATGLLSRLLCRVILSAAPAPLPGWLGWRGHGAALLARVLFGVRNRDVLCPYRLIRRDIFARIPLQSNGTFVHVEILAKANFLGCILSEDVPLGDKDRPVKAEARDGPGEDFIKDCRRVFNRPDFGPVVVPTTDKLDIPDILSAG